MLIPIRRHTRRVFAFLTLGALALTHPLWLAGIGGVLVTEDPLGRVTSVMILDGDGRFEQAARMLASGAARDALVYQARDSWLVEHGVVPAADALARRELARRGVAAERVRVLRGAGHDSRSALRALAQELAAAPQKRVAVLTDRVGSRSVSVLAARLLGPAARTRVAIVPLRDRRYDETSFWRCRAGLKASFNATIDLAFAWLRPDAPPEPPWRPEPHMHALAHGRGVLDPIPWPAAWLDVGAAPQPVDYAFVMPGDLKYRLATGAAMVRAGLARALVLPTTELSSDVQDGIAYDNATLTRKVLALLGVPDERIVVLERGSASTFDDLLALGGFLRAHPRARVAIVTDRLHTRRTRFTAEQFLGGAASGLVYVSTPSPALQSQPWWSTASGVSMVISESLKLTAYWFRYGSGVPWVVLIAVAAALSVYARRRRRRKS